MSNILVVGGTGMLGAPVAKQLKADGFLVRIMSRNPKKAAQQLGPGFEYVQGDVEQPETLRAALASCAGVHINLNGGPTPADYDRIEHRGTVNVVRAAADLGINHISYLSGFSVSKKNSHFYATKAKYEAENAIKTSGIPYTIFRATWFMETLPQFIQGNRAAIIGKQITPLHWIAAADYAHMVSKAYQLSAATNQTFYIGGPEALSMTEAVTLYCQLVRPDVTVSRLPVWLFSLLATLSRDATMKDAGRFMAYNATLTEPNEFQAANSLLGAPQTTLQEWCERQTAVSPLHPLPA